MAVIKPYKRSFTITRSLYSHLKTWLVQVAVVSSGPDTEAGGGMLRDLLGWISGPGLLRVKRLRTPLEFSDCWLIDRDLATGVVGPARAPPLPEVIKGELPVLGAADNEAPADFWTKGDDKTFAVVGVPDVVVAGVELAVDASADFLAKYF